MIFGQHFLVRQDAKSFGCLCYLLLSNYEGLNLNLRKRRQLLVYGDVESNPGPSRNYYKSPCGGTPKKIDLVSDNGKVDFNVIRDKTAPIGLMNNRENVCLFLLCRFRCYICYHCLEIILANYNLRKE